MVHKLYLHFSTDLELSLSLLTLKSPYLISTITTSNKCNYPSNFVAFINQDFEMSSPDLLKISVYLALRFCVLKQMEGSEPK